MLSQKYVAWNGEDYPWPPPEGWYEASDDRWWAPNTGPGPKNPNLPIDTEPQPSATPKIDDLLLGDASEPTGKQPAIDHKEPYLSRSVADEPRDQQPTDSSTVDATGPTPTIEPTVSQSAVDSSTPQTVAQESISPESTVAPETDDDRYGSTTRSGPAAEDNNKKVLLVGGVAGLLAIGALIYFLLRSGPDQASAPESTTVTTIETTTTTTVEPTTTTVEPTTTTAPVDQAAALKNFRSHVDSIDVVGLDDDGLAEIGAEACRFGGGASDAAAWNKQLDDIVASITAQQEDSPPDSGTVLDDESIRSIYNGAAFHYCPAEAKRLEISL